MSASREKKQRQGSGPSEREVQAQQQTAAYQRKVRTYIVIGVVVVILVAALLIWNSGIFQRNQTAATVGDTNYTVNEVNYYYQSARYNAFISYYYFGGTIPDDDDVMDAESGKTYRDYFLERALDSLTGLTAMYDKAIENGYSEKDVADTVQAQIDSVKSSAASSGYSYSAYLKAQYGRYMTTSAFKSILTKSAVADAYYSAYADSLTYTDEEIQAYYDENKNSLDTFEYSFLYFTPDDIVTDEDEELSEEETAQLEALALASAKDKAAHALDQINDGASVTELAEEYELATSAYGDHVVKLGSSVSSGYNEELFGFANGESGIVENGESGYYVVVLHERKLVEDPTADVRHILINAETTTDADGNTVAPTDEAWAAAKAKIDEVLAEYRSGEQTEDAFAALANQYSDDTGSNANGGLIEGASNGDFVPEFNAWVFDSSRQIGEVSDVIQHAADEDDTNTYYGYHIVYYVGQNDPVWKQTVIEELRDAELTDWQEELESTYTASLTSASKYVAN